MSADGAPGDFPAEIPQLASARLTYGPLEERDIPRYNRLLLDKERNRFWGYDDAGAFGDRRRYDSFYLDAWNDFRNGEAVNFAVRLDDELIGEAVIYHFDGDGGAEIGLRIDGEHGGSGYGAEVYGRIADWALDELGLHCLRERCYKDNAACLRFLEADARTRRVGEDAGLYCFERT